jgi:uncharacterized protein
MERELGAVEPLVYESQINVPYHWWAGETASRFFVSLRDKRQILGTKCGRCAKVYVPPRNTCPQCFNGDMSWVELPPTGELITYTVVRRQLDALSKKTPVIFGLIRLDGADTGLLHMLRDLEPKDIAIGMRLQAVFADDRKGNIFDIAHFRPL